MTETQSCLGNENGDKTFMTFKRSTINKFTSSVMETYIAWPGFQQKKGGPGRPDSKTLPLTSIATVEQRHL